MKYDVLIYGGTVAGIAAALASSRMTCATVLVERGNHLGGMMASGLGAIDTLREGAFGGICREFLQRVRQYYVETYGSDSEQGRLTYNGYFMEPHGAEEILGSMMAAEPSLRILRRRQLLAVEKDGVTVTGSTYRDRDTGATLRVSHAVAIDGTYEGDLAAAAGVPYRIGREGRTEFGEKFAGVIFHEWRYHRREILPESTGEPSEFVQANCFRMTLCDDAATRVRIERAASYGDWLPLYRDLLVDSITDACATFGISSG